jgi:DNA-binding response OmpR family regulator
MRILIVEDDPTIRMVLRRAVEMFGHTPVEAEEGQAALDELTHTPCDVVLLDLMLPGLDGFGFLERYRPGEGSPRARVLVCSGAGEQALQKALDLGADDVLAKPFSFEALKLALDNGPREV